MNSESKKEKMDKVSMQIILHAGDAKCYTEEALSLLKTFSFEEAEKKMELAKQELTLAHASQTELIQAEARGTQYPINLLFNHSQDTLMTSMIFYDTALQLLPIVKAIYSLSTNKKTIDSLSDGVNSHE